MSIENVFILNNKVVSHGVTHKLVQISDGICYGCAFDKDDGVTCENIPEYVKKMCIETGSIWVAE